jgi:hypothetical protein
VGCRTSIPGVTAETMAEATWEKGGIWISIVIHIVAVRATPWYIAPLYSSPVLAYRRLILRPTLR